MVRDYLIYVRLGETPPAGVGVTPPVTPQGHANLMLQGGVVQCLDCGRWTRAGEEVLARVDCSEVDDDDAEVR